MFPVISPRAGFAQAMSRFAYQLFFFLCNIRPLFALILMLRSIAFIILFDLIVIKKEDFKPFNFISPYTGIILP